MSAQTDNLVILAQNGDADAFGELYEIYYKEMFAYALAMTRDEELAQDAVGDAVLAAFETISSLRKIGSFKNWIFKILNASCKRQYIKRQKQNNLVYLDDEENGVTDVPVMIDTDLSVDIQRTLSVLSEEEREIVLLSIVADYKSHEIAEVMNLPSSTVRSKLKRALEKCRRVYYGNDKKSKKGGNSRAKQ